MTTTNNEGAKIIKSIEVPGGYFIPANVSRLPQDVSLEQIFAKIRAGWLLFVIMPTIGAIIGVVLALVLPRNYTVEALISRHTPDSGLGSSISRLAGQFGGLMSLGGLNLNQSDETEDAVATLESRILAETFIEDHHLMPLLFPKKWNAARGVWTNPEKAPTLREGSELFRKKIREIRRDRATGLITVIVNWRDPQVAAQWANELVELTNKIMREKSLRRTDKNINFLRETLSKTNEVELAQSLNNLLEQQMNEKMITAGNEEYSFVVIDPAVPNIKNYFPKPSIFGIGGLSIGLGLAFFSALLITPRTHTRT